MRDKIKKKNTKIFLEFSGKLFQGIKEQHEKMAYDLNCKQLSEFRQRK